MHLSAKKQFSRGLSFSVAYPWSKLINDAGVTTTGFAGEGFAGGAIQNFLDRRQERARAAFDTPHNLSISYVWDLPFGKGQRFLNTSRLLDKIVGGWQLNGIPMIMSGTPIGISGGNASQAFAGTQRPHWTGRNATLPGATVDRLDLYFDTSAFYSNEPFTFDHAPRVMPNLRAPGVTNFDLSLFKNFPIGDRYGVQFRSEFFNVFNTPQFGFPASSINARNFGAITDQVNSPRDVQLAVRFHF